MTTFADGIRQGIRNLYCSSLRTTAQFWGNFPSLMRPQPVAGLANFWNRQYCQDEEELPPFLNPQPLQGQCSGVEYAVTAQGENNLGSVITATRSGTGPFQGLALSGPNSQGNFAIGLQFTPDFVGITVVTAANAQVRFETWEVLSVVRVDGLPDNCGGIPDPLPDPEPIETEISITYGDNNQFSLTTPIFFLPVINNFNGQLQIPIELPDINIRGNINITPDGEIDLDFDFPKPRPVPDGDDELPDPDPEDGDEIPEEPEDEPDDTGDPPILAVFGKVVTTTRTRATTIFQPNAPNIIAPRVGIARFRVSTGSGSAWGSDIPIKNQDFLIPCPAPWGAIEAAVVADTGVAIEWGTLRGFTTFLNGAIVTGEGGSSDRRNETG